MGPGGFPSGSVGKNPLAMKETMQEMWVWSLGEADPLEEGMAPHSSIHAWRILWTEEPGGLQSIVLHTVRRNWKDLASTHLTTRLPTKEKKKKTKKGRKEGRKETRKGGSCGICWHLRYNYYHYGWLQVTNVILLNTKLGRDAICSISTIYP